MKSLKVLFCLFLTLTAAFSVHARKPAVEDFVGVEPESYSRTPQGTEVLFEFGNTVKAFRPYESVAPKGAEAAETFWTEWTPIIALLGFLLLPSIMWHGITRSANRHEASGQTEPQPKEEVAVVSVFHERRKPQKAQRSSAEESASAESTEPEDDFKKAS